MFDLQEARKVAEEAPKFTDHRHREAYILPALLLKKACDEIERLLNVAKYARDFARDDCYCIVDPPCRDCHVCNLKRAFSELDNTNYS